MKDTIAIAFNAGSYGTYLEWCLTTLVNGNLVQEPFTSLGNSHKFTGNHLVNIDGWRQYVASNSQHRFVRLHPKTSKDQSINETLTEILHNAKNVIYVYPGETSLLLGLNNYFYKIWPNWIERYFNSEIDLRVIYNNWPVAKDTPVDQIPVWIMREFLSHYLVPAWLDQIEWYQRDSWKHPNLLTVTVPDLLFDFENTLEKIQKFCNLNYCQPASSLIDAHKKNLELQKYASHDRVCHSIIESVVNQTDLSWPELSLPSEAWVQWELRNQGYEIQCDGLNKFPTTSAKLLELLYAV